MEMTRFEKRFVNRKKKSAGNIKKIQSVFKQIETYNIKTVLEIGGGVGFVSAWLAETHNFSVYGTDFDKEQIDIALQLQPKLDHLHYQAEDAAKLTFEDSNFDLIFSQNVFHHIPNWQDAVKEIARVLHSGGYLIWLDLAFSALIKKIFKPLVKNYGLYTIKNVRDEFKLHGLNEISYERFTHGLMRQHQCVLKRL